MLTTAGVTAFATSRKVVAVIGVPLNGALLYAGAAMVWAADCGVRSRRDAMTIPTASDAIAISNA